MPVTGDRWPKVQRVCAAAVVTLPLAAAYAAYAANFPALFFGAPGVYGSIDEVLALLNADYRVALAASVHGLAFDLLVGSFIVGAAHSLGHGAPCLVPALLQTLLFGPAGCLWFRAQVLLRGKHDRLSQA